VWRRFSDVLNELLIVLKLLRAFLWAWVVQPDGLGRRTQIKEELICMAKVFTYRQELLPVKPGVAQQRLTVSVNGVAQEPQVLTADATSAEFKAGPEGAAVDLRLDYLDSAGNDSSDFESSFVVADTIPPAGPEGLGALTQIAEEDDGT
jgi:hypothetical protein